MNVWKGIRLPLVPVLVTTQDGEGRGNGRPSSWWTPTSYDPPMLVMATKPGTDTDLNITKTGQFCCHFPGRAWAKEVLHTAKPLPYGDNELDDQEMIWTWYQGHMMPLPMPIIEGMPWVMCWAMSKFTSGDHHLYEAQVGIAAGFDDEKGISDVVLHRGRNVFVEVGGEYEVPPY